MSEQQGFPNITWQMTDKDGAVTLPWYRFFVSLWNRTGGAQGTTQVLFPVGTVLWFAGSGVPTRTLLCNGQAVNRITYADLFTAIGTSWGSGDGSTTFNVPDLIGLFPYGGIGANVGTTGGNSTVTLAEANLAAHAHGVTDPGHTHVFTADAHTHTLTDPGHLHASVAAASNVTAGAAAGGVNAGNTATAVTGVTVDSVTITGTNASATTGITTTNTGSATPFDILPPYGTLLPVIRY